MTTPTATIFVPFHAVDDLLQQGLRADQPAAADVVPGTLYSVTDEGSRIEQSDGATWTLYAPTGGGGGGGTPDPHHASHEPGGSDALVDVAWTDQANVFTDDQTIDGDLFVTGTIHPLTDAQRAAINALIGEEGGARTLMSSSFVSGLSLRHDESVARGRIACGNYDTQTYQPLALEVEQLEVHTGVSPAGRVEHLRVHPLGGVTVGVAADHATDPGEGVLQARGLGTTPLDANQLLSGTVPDARLSANVQLKPLPPTPPTAHHATHEPGGSDALTALSASTLTTGTVADARLSANVALRDNKNYFSDDQFIRKPGASLRMVDLNGAADQQLWVIGCDQKPDFYLQARTDAGAITANAAIFRRTGDVQIGRDVYEKGRVVPMGHWQDVPFNAGNFVGGFGLTWTVTASQVLINHYTLIGKTLTWVVAVEGSASSGASAVLYCLVPPGLQAAKVYDGMGATARIIEAGGAAVGFSRIINGNTLQVEKVTGATFTGTPLSVWLSVTCEVA